MVENQLPSPQLTPPITPNENEIQNRRRLNRNNNTYVTRNNFLRDEYFMDFELHDHMTTIKDDSNDERTICSDEEEEVGGNKLDEETICSDNEELNYDDDMESFDLNVSESEIENGSEHEYEGDEEDEYEESEEYDEEIQDEETVDKMSREVIDSFFSNMDKGEASYAFEILQELIDECILDVAFEMHRQAKTEKLCTRTFQIQDSNLLYLVDKQGYDIFGQNINTLRLQAGKQRCLNCNVMFPVSTYVKHFSKCLGDEQTDKFSIFDYPESSSSSFISNGEMDIDTQVTRVTDCNDTYVFSNRRPVLKTYAKRRTIRQI
ncbi:hypothetical protein C1646_662210 [Rhizophagus diaphanus]|nr:hypothetical protein C1646_662210 [Rhizophagus diaphanus] [Rhizophagus sp. MUCL 43196]